ncbi:major facilitator superfamily-domain-containing protein [Apiosordaria backusii]|uniref:Major facilitator superfamily-domain-containing protein n=1 Tax=Apiosordaria backusii TaxID=314023 RepID=A0AA40DUV4_9PEZI|nr:major facilitator superfamily-domain-containing protein [Apiosordaria backusii]
MDNRRRSSSWADQAAVDAMQRAADAMIMATESFRLQFQGQPREVNGQHHPNSSTVDDILSERRASRQCGQIPVSPRRPISEKTGDVGPDSAGPPSSNPPSMSINAEFLPRPSNPTVPQPTRQQHISIHIRHNSGRKRATSQPHPAFHKPFVPRQLSREDHGRHHPLPCPPVHPALRDDNGSEDKKAVCIERCDLVNLSDSQSTMVPTEETGIDTSCLSSASHSSPHRKSRAASRAAMTSSSFPYSSSASSAAAPPPAAQPPSTRPEVLVSPSHEILSVLLICLAQILMLAGLAQAMIPASIISQSFDDSTPGTMAWYSAAYGLTSATFVLPSGRVGDLFGHKKVFVAGWLWFGVWSLIAGFSGLVERNGGRGTVFFCVARGLQGIGPALLVPSGQALLGRTYKPGMRKNMVLCLFGASAPLGFVMGAIFSSLFTVRGHWPWAFWLFAIMCFVLAVVSLFILPTSRGQSCLKKGESLWAQFDGWGMILGVSGLVLLNFAFNQAPIVSWKTPYTYFLLIIGLMLIAAFVVHEWAAPYPLIPISAMKPATNFVLACTGTGWGCFSIWIYYTFSIVENLRGWSPLLASVSFMPAFLVGFLMSRVKPHWIMLISMCAFSVGSLLLATAPVHQSYWFNTFFGILIMPFATILLSNSVSKEHQGIAASLVVTTVNYSYAAPRRKPGLVLTLRTEFLLLLGLRVLSKLYVSFSTASRQIANTATSMSMTRVMSS